jgi:hypothetical protein
MRTLFTTLFLACLVGCAPKAVSVVGAPRAIPVAPVIAQLDKRIKSVSHKTEDIQRQAEKARDKGLTANSPEANKLVNDITGIRIDLDAARVEITQIRERAAALVVERDAFFKQVQDLDKKNRDLSNKVAVIESKKRFWMIYSGIASLLILLFILYKLAQIYSISINPLNYLQRP